MYHIATLTITFLLLASSSLAQEEPTTELVSIMPNGNQFPERGGVFTQAPGMSADGRFVVFEAFECGKCTPHVYRRDRTKETTELVSVDSEGNPLWGILPAISADGRYVVFSDQLEALWRRDMDAAGVDEWIPVPTTDSEFPNAPLLYPAISADARIIAFMSLATNLLPGGNTGYDIYAYDTDADTLERVSVASDGSSGNGLSRYLALSADGRFVAFVSLASNLVSDDTNDAPDVFIHDRTTGATERVSVASNGSEGNASSGVGGLNSRPSISADGRLVAFNSVATNLVPDHTHAGDVYVHDRETGATELVTVAHDGGQANEVFSNMANISADGRYVTFASNASNLIPDDTNGNMDIFIRDRTNGTTERISVAYDGSEAWSDFGNGIAATADGRFVAFQSHHSQLVPGGTNDLHHLFVRDRGPLVVTTEDGPTAFHLSNATPNPTSDASTFTIAVENGQNVTVEVFDATGRRVQTVYEGALAAGMSETLTLDGSALPAGVYVIRATGEDFSETRRVTIVR